MSLTRKLLFPSLGLAAVALAAGFMLVQSWFLALLVIGMGGFWAVAVVRGWDWSPSLGFGIYIGAAAFGLAAGLSSIAMLVGLSAGLAAWDLSYFDRRLQAVKTWTPALADIQRRHLARLGIVLTVGCLVAVVEMALTIQLSLLAAVVLGLAAVLGLTQLVQSLNRAIK